MKKKIGITIVIILSTIFVISVTKSIITILGSGNRLQEEQASLDALQKENRVLKQQIGIAQQPDYVEKVAHDQLNMVFPNENVIVLPQQATTSAQLPKILDNRSNWSRWYALFFERI